MQSHKFEIDFNHRTIGYLLLGLALVWLVGFHPILILLFAACYFLGCFPFSGRRMKFANSTDPHSEKPKNTATV